MKFKHSRQQVVDWMIKRSDGKVTGYTKYDDDKYVFFDGCGFCAILNKDFGYLPNNPQLRIQLTRDQIDTVCNALRPNPSKDVTKFDSDFQYYRISYKQLCEWQKAANEEKKTKNLKYRPSIHLAGAWYDSDLLIRAMELINIYGGDAFEAYYDESKGSLSTMWFFNSDGECAWVCPVLKRKEEELNQKGAKRKV